MINPEGERVNGNMAFYPLINLVSRQPTKCYPRVRYPRDNVRDVVA